LEAVEHHLSRNVRTVMDIGCGEGEWFVVLSAIRPALRYEGLDPSAYVVRRFGRSRHIRLGRLGASGSTFRRYDLVICVDVLHYLSDKDVRCGLRAIASMTGGVAFLELMTSGDGPTGDLEGFQNRSEQWYQRQFERAGLVSCGKNLFCRPARDPP
jgi:SAM-dependent methyltransferase